MSVRSRLFLLAACSAAITGSARGQSPFATEVYLYQQGGPVVSDWYTGQPFNDPAAALGSPTIDTTGDDWSFPLSARLPVVPVSGPWRPFELVSIGEGGTLILKFDHPVTNDPANPYGMDFTIFGNARLATVQAPDGYWTYGDPNLTLVGEVSFAEPGIVSVSQDGQTWFTFTNAFADTAPALGRVYDPANPDTTLGDWNHWWGRPTNPLLPLDPAIGSVYGKTVAEVAMLYGESAGGNSFDIGVFPGLDWIQYVRIYNPLGSGFTTEIDAIADVAPLPEPAATLLMAVAAAILNRRRR